MYLLEINEETGLISEDVTNTGWRGIKALRELFKKYGLEGLTCVAFACDYQSPYRHYNSDDRPARAMDEVYEDRNKLDFLNDPVIVAAVEKYNDLQFNADLEQERIYNETKLRYLKKIREANTKEDDTELAKFTQLLQKHENNIKAFNSRFNRKESLAVAVTSNNYELTRIENDMHSRKNSKFELHGKDVSNPNKLNLED